MWTFTTMLFYTVTQNSSKTWQRRVTKSWQNQDNQFVQRLRSKCPPFARTQALSPLRHWSIAMLTVNCSRPHQTSVSVCFSSSMVLGGIHYAAWQPRSRNQLDWDLDCLEVTNLGKWSLVFFDAEPPQFHAHNVQMRPWTVTLVLVLQSLATVGIFSFLLWAISFWLRHWKNFKNRPTFAKVTAKIKVDQFFLTHSVITCVIVFRVFTIKPQMVENAFLSLLGNKNVQNCYIYFVG